MGGPAMIEGGGLGAFAPEEVGPIDDAGAERRDRRASSPTRRDAVAVAKQYLALLPGRARATGRCADQRLLRAVVPEDPKRVHDVRRAARAARRRRLACSSCAASFGRTMLTALARIEGRPVGVIANDPQHLAGAIDSDGSDKAARFMQLCDAFGLPIVSLFDTPGLHGRPGVGARPRWCATARACSSPRRRCRSRSSASSSGARFGLGAQAMAGGALPRAVLSPSPGRPASSARWASRAR